MCYNIGIKGKGGSTQNIYYLGKETMNEIFTNPDKMREYEKHVTTVSEICQRIGMGVTLVTWVMFFLLYEPDIFRPFVWILVVGLQFMIIRKVLERFIPIWYEDMPRTAKAKSVSWFVLFGALVLLLEYEKTMQIPIYLLVVYVAFIWLGAEIVYACTEMP